MDEKETNQIDANEPIEAGEVPVGPSGAASAAEEAALPQTPPAALSRFDFGEDDQADQLDVPTPVSEVETETSSTGEETPEGLGQTEEELEHSDSPISDSPEEPAPALPALAPTEGSPQGGIAKATVAVAVIAALLIGLLIGSFVLNGARGGVGGSALMGKTSVTEAELDSAMGAFTVDGKTTEITVREALEQTSSLTAAKDEAGNYKLPSADSVLAVARNKVLVAAAEAQGIKATDEDVAAFAQQQLGTSDYASVAANYGMDENSVADLMRQSYLMNTLRESVMGGDESQAALPEAPAEPASTSSASASESESSSSEAGGEESATQPANVSVETKEYADYIIGLAGDEWDASKGTWAKTDGPYYQALSSFNITPEKASYEAAMAAYYVAYQLYSESNSATAEVWGNYVNELLSKVNITVYSLLA